MKIIAIVPIKNNSDRIPGKNFKLLGGKPMYHWILQTLSQCYPLVTHIVINTDSQYLKNECPLTFPNVLIYNRPENLCGDEVSVNNILLDTIDNFIPTITDINDESTIYLQTHVTNPFLSKETIIAAIHRFIAGLNQPFDSLFSVNSFQTRLYNNQGLPINHQEDNLLPTQLLEPIYEENSCLYLFTLNSFRKRNHRIGYQPIMYPIPSKIESLDIDWEEDFQLAQIIAQEKERTKEEQGKIKPVVIITGASGGIGLATSQYFNEKGWSVIGIDINPYNNKFNEINDIFLEYWTLDLTKNESIQIITERIKNGGYKVLGLVNVAAIQACNLITETGEAEWDKIMNCNLKAIFFLSQALVPFLQKNRGSIVNITSVHSLQSSDQIAVYAASKAGLLGLTRNMAIEFAKMGIRVNCLSPGAIDTPMLRSGLSRANGSKSITDLVDQLGKKHLAQRVGQPEEIATGIYFLINNKTASFIYGSHLVVDGGATIKLSTE